jgi:DNA-binding transcriptional ArsR family regulator
MLPWGPFSAIGTVGMSDDWLDQSLDGVADAARAAMATLAAVIDSAEAGRHTRRAGAPLLDVVDGLVGGDPRAARRRAAEALDAYERSLTSLRTAAVRMLVDEQGMTVADLSRRLGVSRQMVSRLYHGPR